MKYICSKYDLPDHWYPKDLQQRAKTDEYLAWHHTNLRMGVVDIVWGKVCLFTYSFYWDARPSHQLP